MKGLLAAVSVGALLTAAPAWAQSLSQQDKTFVHEASAGNLAEPELGKLAEQKAAAPAVKEFGRWMATDHGFARKWLGAIPREEAETLTPNLTWGPNNA